MAQSTIARKILTGAGFAIVGLFTIIDQIAGPAFRPLIRILSQSSPIAWLRRLARRLPARVALVALLVPFAGAEPAKIYGLYLMGEGRFTFGLVTIALAYHVSLLLVDTIYDGARPQLRSIAWFAAVVDWLAALKNQMLDAVRATATYRALADWTLELRARLRDARRSLQLTRARARVSRRADAVTDEAKP